MNNELISSMSSGKFSNFVIFALCECAARRMTNCSSGSISEYILFVSIEHFQCLCDAFFSICFDHIPTHDLVASLVFFYTFIRSLAINFILKTKLDEWRMDSLIDDALLLLYLVYFCLQTRTHANRRRMKRIQAHGMASCYVYILLFIYLSNKTVKKPDFNVNAIFNKFLISL